MIKLQVACLVTLLFIAVIYFSVKRKKTYSHRLFSISLGVVVINLIFDIITVYTVNHLGCVSELLNRFCHIIFLGSLIVEVYICFLYSSTLIFPNDEEAKRENKWSFIPMCFACLALLLLPLDYVQTDEGNYSWGLSVIGVYAMLAIYLVMILFEMLYHWKQIQVKKRTIVLLAFIIEIVVSTMQAIKPTLLISGAGLTLLNLAFFLTVESPDVHLIERLREEKERADGANEAKSKFLSNMSHEIRTPMNAIVGLTEVLMREDIGEKERKYLQNIRSSGDALLGLINDLLDYSEIESGKFVITEDNYEPLMVLEDLKPVFEDRIGDKPITLNYDVDQNLPWTLYGDGLRIRQILINLTNNAIKYTESGFVTIAIKIVEKKEDEVKIEVSVQDSGQGIRKEDLSRLFDAFTQVDIKKNKGKEGTGLGLAICKQLVDLMGGKLDVQSEYGKGSEFSFTLWQKVIGKETVGDRETKKEEISKALEFDFTAPEARILIVDDMELNREVAIALLEPLQMQIDEAENGYQAVQMVQQKDYDLVLMDHYMPVMDGIEATQKIRGLTDEKYRRLPILALTADVVAGEKENFFKAGMNEVISKPIQVNEMCEKLHKYLDEALIKSAV